MRQCHARFAVHTKSSPTWRFLSVLAMACTSMSTCRKGRKAPTTRCACVCQTLLGGVEAGAPAAALLQNLPGAVRE